MSLLRPLERWLLNLEEDIDPGYLFVYVRRGDALQCLKEQTGQDFGYDAKRWREWLETAGLVPKRNIPAEMLRILEDDFPPGYIRPSNGRSMAVERLRAWTGQDFGADAKRWREWLEQHGSFQAKKEPAEPA